MAMGLVRAARLIYNWAEGHPGVSGAQALNEASPGGWCGLADFMKSPSAGGGSRQGRGAQHSLGASRLGLPLGHATACLGDRIEPALVRTQSPCGGRTLTRVFTGRHRVGISFLNSQQFFRRVKIMDVQAADDTMDCLLSPGHTAKGFRCVISFNKVLRTVSRPVL